MTQDPRLRDIFGPADETVAALDRLNAGAQARRVDMLGQLRAVVARLDQQPGLPDEPEPTTERPQRDDDRRRRPDEIEEPYVALPQRSQPARGGDYGPAVREKLRRIALERGDW
jgi:hypothetical protein